MPSPTAGAARPTAVAPPVSPFGRVGRNSLRTGSARDLATPVWAPAERTPSPVHPRAPAVVSRIIPPQPLQAPPSPVPQRSLAHQTPAIPPQPPLPPCQVPPPQPPLPVDLRPLPCGAGVCVPGDGDVPPRPLSLSPSEWRRLDRPLASRGVAGSAPDAKRKRTHGYFPNTSSGRAPGHGRSCRLGPDGGDGC